MAVFRLDCLRNQPPETTQIDGVPELAIEILSPSDKNEDMWDKLDLYKRFGVPMIWRVDPYIRKVEIHCGDDDLVVFNSRQILTDDKILPGFEVAVKDLFPAW